jgi:demethylmenaquinone methyltransferase/2-methoxy-6-polyprenyl-1,4-benzoquinol methylase
MTLRPGSERVRFVLADLFTWRPERRYDGVFTGFWISHVPRSRFADFWARVDHGLRPGGRVLFVDDAHRTDQELIEGEPTTTTRRRLRDGTPHRVVEVPHTPEGLERELTAPGWSIRVHRTSGPFHWGTGGRRSDSARRAARPPGRLHRASGCPDHRSP